MQQSTLSHLKASVEAGPESIVQLRALGIALQRLGRYEESLKYFGRATRLEPGNVESHLNLAASLIALGMFDDASSVLESALRLAPQSLDVCYRLASVYRQHLGRLDQSNDLYRKCIHSSPDFLHGYIGICHTLVPGQEAFEAAQQVANFIGSSAKPSHIYTGLGWALRDAGRYFEAKDCWLRALSIDSRNSTALRELAEVETAFGEMELAKRYLSRSLELEVNLPNLTSYILHLFRVGDLSQAKLTVSDPQFLRILHGNLSPSFSAPEWDGSPLEGKTVFMETPGGFGDAIQYCRFADFMKQQNATVICEVSKPVASLLQTISWIDHVVLPYSECPPFDYRCRADLACFQLDWNWQDLVRQKDYVRPPADLISTWKKRLGAYKGLRVGINWSSQPHWAGDPYRFRSASLEQFRPLLQVPGVVLFALQTGPARRQLTDLAFSSTIVDLGDHTTSEFLETAGAIAAMDLVITVDTSIAHLAGALGKPCWILLPRLAGWRWMTHPTETEWYPNARLYRQTEAGNWYRVMSEIQTDLYTLSSSHKATTAT
jgi:tetratricopeptide (TPR) repeat protein